MTDERSRQPGDRLDEAIDRTVHALMSQAAPSTLRAQVLARLSAPASAERRAPSAGSQPVEAGFSRPEVRLKEDPTSVATWSPRRFAWVGAATAVVVGVAFMAPRWWTGPDVPRSRPAVADLTPARPARPPIAAPGATADRPLARVTAASSEAPQFAMPERAPFVDPLPALDAIVIAALETDRVTPAVVEIESLKLDSLHIEPLSAQR